MIQSAEWSQLEQLGDGEYGVVYRVRNLKTQVDCAAKMSKESGAYEQILRKEIDIHSKLSHPNIIQFITSLEPEELCMITELATEGEVFAMVRSGGLKLSQIRS